MSYKIAVASTDGVVVDRSFRDAEEFRIIEVDDDGNYEFGETRKFVKEEEQEEKAFSQEGNCGSRSGCGENTGCGNRTGCGGENSPKLLLIEDCRSLLCTQIGFKIHKQLEKRAISAFEIDCRIDDALKKIINYYDKVDKHQSLRGIAKGQER